MVIAEPESASGKAMADVTGALARQVSIRAFRSLTLSIAEE